MPNGGTDNCGTCSFNKRNKGTTGHLYANVDAPHHCLLRDFQITERSEGFWIYCGNHSQLPNGGIDVPIGPVFKNFSGSSAGERVVVLESPDNSAVRNTLLRFVGSMTAACTDQHYEPYFKQIVLLQLARFRESEATAHIERIANSRLFEPDVSSRVVIVARVALERLRNGFSFKRHPEPFWAEPDEWRRWDIADLA